MSDAKTNNLPPGKSAGALIYVVDDEPMLLELAAAILEPVGYHILTFRDPDVALEQFSKSQKRPDLLMTDYAMHTMNGMQLIEKCRRLEPQQKVLLVSGTVGEEIYEGSTCRPDYFIAKPYMADQLIKAIKRMLSPA